MICHQNLAESEDLVYIEAELSITSDVVDTKLKKFFYLVRALFPRWNFFDRVGFQFNLYFCTDQNSTWTPFNFNQRRRPGQIFFNPHFNLALAHISIIQHFVHDLQSDKNVESLTSFRLLKSFVETYLSEQNIKSNSAQFKIVAQRATETLELFTSTSFSVNSK